MSDRAIAIREFLASTEWAHSAVSPLAGDASMRKYLRIAANASGQPAVMMDADPALGNDVMPFVIITEYLRSVNLSAPKIYARDTVRGFLLIEDLGDDLFARVTETAPQLEDSLYEAAIDVLLHLHDQKPPDIAAYDAELMSELAGLSIRWYAAGATGEDHSAQAAAFEADFADLLDRTIKPPSVLIQRDYHAENLLWLPERTGAARVGLLDYQDALLGHPAYDLVSLLKDARRDVPLALEDRMIRRYLDRTDLDEGEFRDAYHLLGLQRNLRILGVFARLSMHFGKPAYIDLIPRVWGFIERDLATDVCLPIAAQVRATLPTPIPDILQRLKDLCGTVPTR